ncbi:TonB family protein [Klebsiella africana]|uniref:TonB family protein n=1 Tax=Klebsiella africana TaxID=2489010 RepID=A0ACD4ANL9_9ENTR|nr:TonB family protein [Klebsiella africana]USB41309.1 TonB family protein [Klebsiella africana]
MTLKLRYLILFFALLMAFVAPDLVSLLWSAPFRLMDKLPLLPVALNDPQRLYLYGLWLGGTIYFSALMWVAVTRRNKGYLIVAVAQIVFVIGMTLCKVPIGEQNQRRWQSMNQLETPVWSDFLYDRHARFIQIALRGGALNQHKITEQFLAQKKPLASLPLGWNEEDAAAADALWQQALGYREREAKALPKMMDYLAWMPDRGDLTLATAILTLTSEADKARAETAFRRAIAIAPENPDAWLGWAVALIQARDDARVRNSQFQALTQSITTGLLMAEGLEESPRQPALQRRLERYIAQMPADDRQILHILQARMQTRACDLPLDKYSTEQGEASKVLPLAKSIVFKTAPVRSVGPINERFPGHVSIDTERYGVRKESLQAMLYPAIHKYIKRATTILSLDADASGELLNVVVECSSGVPEFDQAALHYAQEWRFGSHRQGKRVLMPVSFISDRVPPEEYYGEMEARAMRISRLAARHNKMGMESASQEMIARFTRMKALFPQQKLSAKEAHQLQLIYLKKRDKTTKGRMESFTEMTEAMEALVDTHPYYAPLLKDLAFRKSYASFEEKRAAWSQLLALAPEDPQVWMAWGSVWADRDPELYMGAMIASMLLQPLIEDTEQKIANIKTKLLMRVGMGPRKAILSAKVYADYGDILGERAKGEDTAKAAAILPASQKLDRQETVAPLDPAQRMTVDIDRDEVLNAALFNVEWKAPQRPDERRAELTVDIDDTGMPTLVLISKSSKVEQYDAQAVNMLWRWKFKPQPDGRRMTVGVNFLH